MSILTLIRALLLCIASFGYVANGAQAHLHISGGESLELLMCGTGSTHTLEVEIPGEPIEETEDTCCGDCLSIAGIAPSTPAQAKIALQFSIPVLSHLPDAVPPRSPPLARCAATRPANPFQNLKPRNFALGCDPHPQF